MEAEFVGHRASVHQDGNLYLARDIRVVDDAGRTRYYPQHAVVREYMLPDSFERVDRLVWIGHEEGGMIEPLVEGFAAPESDRVDLCAA